MDPITLGLLIGGGAGLVKNLAVDRPKEARERKLAAETQRYSPWTGLKAGPIEESDMIGNLAQFGGAGASFGSGVASNQAQNKLLEAQTSWLQNGSSPWSGMRGPNLGANLNFGANPGPGLMKLYGGG